MQIVPLCIAAEKSSCLSQSLALSVRSVFKVSKKSAMLVMSCSVNKIGENHANACALNSSAAIAHIERESLCLFHCK